MSPGHLGITSCTGGWAQTCSARPQCRILVAIESLVRFFAVHKPFLDLYSKTALQHSSKQLRT